MILSYGLICLILVIAFLMIKLAIRNRRSVEIFRRVIVSVNKIWDRKDLSQIANIIEVETKKQSEDVFVFYSLFRQQISNSLMAKSEDYSNLVEAYLKAKRTGYLLLLGMFLLVLILAFVLGDVSHAK